MAPDVLHSFSHRQVTPGACDFMEMSCLQILPDATDECTWSPATSQFTSSRSNCSACSFCSILVQLHVVSSHWLCILSFTWFDVLPCVCLAFPLVLSKIISATGPQPEASGLSQHRCLKRYWLVSPAGMSSQLPANRSLKQPPIKLSLIYLTWLLADTERDPRSMILWETSYSVILIWVIVLLEVNNKFYLQAFSLLLSLVTQKGSYSTSRRHGGTGADRHCQP